MNNDETKENKSFDQTIEDLVDEAEMADGLLLREYVDSLYLRRGLDPDEAVKIENILKDKGFKIKETPSVPSKTDDNVQEQNAGNYSSATDHLLALSKRIELLTADQEAFHGEAIQKAAHLLEKTENDLSEIEKRIIDAGKKSFDTLVRHNIRLVTSFIFNPRYQSWHDTDDMLQMGLLGLMRAAEKFDPEQGCRFSTYAMWWIRQSIHRNIDNEANTIRLPIHMISHVRKYKRALRSLDHSNNNSAPSINKVAEFLGWNTDYTAKVAQISSMRTVSMETPVSVEGSAVLGDFITDESPNPEDIAVNRDTAQHIEELINELPDERSKDIIKRRFGIDRPEETLESIGQSYEITRERIRQLEGKALKRLRLGALRRRLGRLLRK